MSGIRRALVVLVVVELASLIGLMLLVSPAAPLPVSLLGTQETGLMEDLQAAEAKHDPQQMQSWVTIGDFYCAFGLLPEAEYCLQEAESLGTLDEDGLLLRGNILSRLGRMKEAEEYFQRVIEFQGEHASDAWIQLGLDALRRNDPQQAEKALRQSGDQPVAMLALARLLIRTDRAAEAGALLDRILEQYPGSMRALQLKSWACEALGDDQGARENYELSLRHVQIISMLTPVRQHDEEMHQQHGPGRFLFESGKMEQRGDLEAAVDLTEQAIKAMKPLKRSYYSMRAAQLYLDINLPKRALKHLRLVLILDGETAENWELVGNAWLALGDKEKARRAWLEGSRFRASKFMPANQYMQRNLAESAAESGDNEQARHHTGLMHYETGLLAWRENDLRSALVAFTAAVENLPEHAASWYYLAETRRAESDREGARVAYQRCLELNANHGRAIDALALLETE